MTGPRLVVGYDGTPAARAALRSAADLAGRLDGGLDVVHADDRAALVAWAGHGAAVPLAGGAGLGGGAVVEPAALEEGLREQEAAFEAEVRELLAGTPVPWQWHARAGSPVEALRAVADEVDAYALVVGSPGTGPAAWLDHLLTGSVPRALERRCGRPVLVVPAPEERH